MIFCCLEALVALIRQIGAEVNPLAANGHRSSVYVVSKAVYNLLYLSYLIYLLYLSILSILLIISRAYLSFVSAVPVFCFLYAVAQPELW